MPRLAKIPLYFGVPLVVALVFILYEIPVISNWWMEQIPDPAYRIIVQALLLFTVAYIVNRWIYRYYVKHRI